MKIRTNHMRRARHSLSVVAAAAVALVVITGCAPQSTTPTSERVLKVGISGESAGTVLDPHALLDPFGTTWAAAFFEQLGEFDGDGKYHNSLAESFTPNDDATSWVAKLKKGVTFHDGKPLTADDVIFSFNRLKDPATGATNFSTASIIADMTKIDDLTVQFNLVRPVATFPEYIGIAGLGIVEPSYNPKHPVSTGPWKFDSFERNGTLQMSRYKGYHGKAPALAGIEFVALPDDDARTNALLTGQIDADLTMTGTEAERVKGQQNLKVLDISNGGFQVITMRVDRGVTADVRVRQAIRLAVDRQRILDVVFGSGRIGNDVAGIDDPAFRSDLKRTQDVAEAKKLIKEAGAEGAKLTLVTVASVKPVAQIVAQNANDIGLDVTVDLKDDTSFYSQGYLDYDFAVDNWPGTSILTFAALTEAPGASLNYTHVDDPEFNDAYEIAMSSPDAAARTKALDAMQQIEFDRGGTIIPAYGNTLSAVPANTTGWPKGNANGLSIYTALRDVSFTS